MATCAVGSSRYVGQGAADNIRQHPSWSPYDDNGGTTLAVAGEDYCVVAASTRLSSGYSILTRESSKIVQLSNNVVIVSAGFQADIRTLQKTMQARNIQFQHAHRRPMSVNAVAQLLGNTLYYKRFFPYYAWNLVAGLDDEGKGAVYTYDPVGSFERTGYSCQGSGKDLMQPVLDNQLKAASPLVLPPQPSVTNLPVEQAVDLVKDAFVAAGERDIYTGDAVEILVITRTGVQRDVLELKKD
jgi:20S proteasome subunit beta 6